MKQRRVICVAVDGTDSKEIKLKHGTTHTKRLYENCKSNDKAYWDGTPDIITGYSNFKIANGVTNFIKRRLKLLKENEIPDVLMIGHSRGGAALIEVSNSLKGLVKVKTLILLDAVDRSVFTSNTETIKNVDFIFHALRGLSNSRPSFGNVGLNFENHIDYTQTKYKTSHGGINGTVDHNDYSITSDTSCNVKKIYTTVENTQK